MNNDQLIAVADELNRFVDPNNDYDPFYVSVWGEVGHEWLRLRDGFAQSTICSVKENEIPEYLAAVEKYRTNPYDAIQSARRAHKERI